LYTLSCLTINGQHGRQTTKSEILENQHFSLQGKLTLLIYRLPSMNEIETMNTIASRYSSSDNLKGGGQHVPESTATDFSWTTMTNNKKNIR
jgi:hypothetical protein